MSGWIDISMPLRDGMPTWPGDPEIAIRRLARMEDGSPCNLTQMAFSVHTGTHMDAPRHFIADGATMEQMPLDAVNGPCRVIGIADREAIRSAELVRQEIAPGERLLFKTRNRLDGPFDESFVFLAAEAARYLAGRGVRSIGVDGPSIGGFHHDLIETHQTILGAGIWVIECLDLTAVAPGRYELICLPLKIVGADGAPARAMLRALA